MSSLGGSIKFGKRFFSAATVVRVSSTLKVVCDSQATLFSSGTFISAMPSTPSTKII